MAVVRREASLGYTDGTFSFTHTSAVVRREASLGYTDTLPVK